MKKQVGYPGTMVTNDPGHGLFISLEKFFIRNGHNAVEAFELAYEAMDEFESWYEEKMEAKNDEN